MDFSRRKKNTHYASNMAITCLVGGSRGIGAAILKKLVQCEGGEESSNDRVCRVVCMQRSDGVPLSRFVPLDLASTDSISSAVEHLAQRVGDEKIQTLVLNSGVKATRSTVDWFGVSTNVCKVINVLGYRYLVSLMRTRGLLAERVRILCMGSVWHWYAQPTPQLQASADRAIASKEYANSKRAIMRLCDQWAASNPSWECIVFNPGYVDTTIFRHPHRFVRWVQSYLATRPDRVADYVCDLLANKPHAPGASYVSIYQDSRVLRWMGVPLAQDVLIRCSHLNRNFQTSLCREWCDQERRAYDVYLQNQQFDGR